jgi:integrase
MAITLIKRHVQDCPLAQEGVPNRRKQFKCGCAFTLDLRPFGGFETLDTRDLHEAERIMFERRTSGLSAVAVKQAASGPVTLDHALHEYFRDPEILKLRESTRRKHRTLLAPHGLRRDPAKEECYKPGQLTVFAEARRVTLVSDLDATFIAAFRASWTEKRLHPTNGRTVMDNPKAAAKKLERFRQFCRFLHNRDWIKTNPMKTVRPMKVKHKQKPPFTDAELKKILETLDADVKDGGVSAVRLRALVLFLLFSGLRISDAVSCQMEWVSEGRVRIAHCRKTDRTIDVPLPPEVLKALAECPPMSDLFWFWSGNGQLETATKHWQGELSAMFRLAGIQQGHAHRFRDTFAVAMLEAGKSMQEVADALGDTLAVAEKHYNPWSKTRQARLDEAIASTWKGNKTLAALAPKNGKLVAWRKAK